MCCLITVVQSGAPKRSNLVYNPHEYYSYLRLINHSYYSYLHQLSYRKRGPHIVGTMIYSN